MPQCAQWTLESLHDCIHHMNWLVYIPVILVRDLLRLNNLKLLKVPGVYTFLFTYHTKVSSRRWNLLYTPSFISTVNRQSIENDIHRILRSAPSCQLKQLLLPLANLLDLQKWYFLLYSQTITAVRRPTAPELGDGAALTGAGQVEVSEAWDVQSWRTAFFRATMV